MHKFWNALKRVNTTVWVIVILLIVVRIFLPTILTYTINWYLGNKIEHYQGHIEDFDLALWRGAYQIEGLKIWKRGTAPDTALISVQRIDLSLAWRAIWHRQLLGDLRIDGMKLLFRDSESEKKRQLGGEEKNWNEVASTLIPINIESLQVSNGAVHFINNDTKIPVDMYVDQIEVYALNLKNIDQSHELLPSPVSARARVFSSTPFRVDGRLNLLNEIPTFDIQAELKKLPLPKLNPFFMVYGPFSVARGDFSFYTEVAATQKKIKGYVKPFLENVKMESPHEHYQSFRQWLNELVLGTGNLIFRNHEKVAATRIDFEGDMEAPGVHKWRAVGISLKNAFGRPLREAIDKSISIKDVPVIPRKQ